MCGRLNVIEHPIVQWVAQEFGLKIQFAFRNHRCLIPCMGWCEWKDEGGSRKQKNLFGHDSNRPCLMAGIRFNTGGRWQLVSLTTKAIDDCANIHNRMPLLIDPALAIGWLETCEFEKLDYLLMAGDQQGIVFSKVG